MQALDPPILFEKQHHQEECIERIMGALEENQDSRQLAVKAHFDFNPAFPRKPENRLDILMETGTGKTYVYLKAIFEMHKRFGKTKFVIIVPRTSIKLGVMQNVRLTANHFFTRYGRHLRCVSYPEDGVDGVLSGFLRTNDLSVLLTTNSAFNHKGRLINQTHETLYRGHDRLGGDCQDGASRDHGRATPACRNKDDGIPRCPALQVSLHAVWRDVSGK